MSERLRIAPQAGPQTAFLASGADIVIFGGSAGGGKSWAVLIEALRHAVTNPGFSAVFFRRTSTDIRNPGGLWDESEKLYSQIPGATSVENVLEWQFSNGGKIKFAHLQHEKNVLDWKGAQVPLLIFDEITSFTAKQFWYMLSRNRSMCGVRPYIRATTNPEADSWVADLIAWWIDQDTGLAIPERSGVIRYFIRINDSMIWRDTPGELLTEFPDCQPKSFTFIRSSLSDNKALMDADPGYRANLMALSAVERARLLDGNWKIRPASGLYFQREWCEETTVIPPGTKFFRGWDHAATPKTETNDPDWTCGTLIGRRPDGGYIVCDHLAFRCTPGEVKTRVKNTATRDPAGTVISIAQDPGQAGKAQVEDYRRLLDGYNIRFSPETGEKIVRFAPFSAQAEAHGVSILKGAWNERFYSQLEAFPEGSHDDDADSTSRAYQAASNKGPDYGKRMGALTQ